MLLLFLFLLWEIVWTSLYVFELLTTKYNNKVLNFKSEFRLPDVIEFPSALEQNFLFRYREEQFSKIQIGLLLNDRHIKVVKTLDDCDALFVGAYVDRIEYVRDSEYLDTVTVLIHFNKKIKLIPNCLYCLFYNNEIVAEVVNIKEDIILNTFPFSVGNKTTAEKKFHQKYRAHFTPKPVKSDLLK